MLSRSEDQRGQTLMVGLIQTWYQSLYDGSDSDSWVAQLCAVAVNFLITVLQ